MTISGASGTSGDLNVRAAELYSMGTAEASVAMASVHLEEQQVTAKQAQRAAQQSQRAAAERRIDEMQDAAAQRLAAGLIRGVAEVGAGVMGGSQGGSRLIEGTGKALGAGCDFLAARSDADAAAAQEAGSRHQQYAQELGDDLDRAGRLADKAANHLEQVTQARREAERLASSRG